MRELSYTDFKKKLHCLFILTYYINLIITNLTN